MSRRNRKSRRKITRFHKRAAPGAVPGMIIPAPGAPKPIIDVIQYGPDEFLEDRITNLDGLPQRLKQYPVMWVNVSGLGDAAIIEKLGRIFGLHLLALEDVVNVHQRPKVEDYGDHLFVVARMLTLEERLDTEQISLFLGRNFVLTFQERPGDCLNPVRERLRKKQSRIHQGSSDYLLYSLLDAVLDAYFPIVEQFGERIDTLDEEIISDMQPNTVHRIHEIRNEMLLLRKVGWRMRDVVNSLIRDEFSFIGDEVRIFLRDCYDHTIQIVDVVDTDRELLSDLRDFYLTQVANRTNDIMKVLTIIATIFIPLSFIAGVFGMNFNPEKSPWNMPELNWTYGYPFALGLMGAVGVGLLYFFRRRGWLWK